MGTLRIEKRLDTLPVTLTTDTLYLLNTSAGLGLFITDNTTGQLHSLSYSSLVDRPFIPTSPRDIGLGNVNNTSDLAKPVSTATQAALDLKVDKTTIDSILGGSGAVDTIQQLTTLMNTDITNIASLTNNVSALTANKANSSSPTFTGTTTFTGDVIGLTAKMVGLDSYVNYTPATLPISTATQTILTTIQNTLGTLNAFSNYTPASLPLSTAATNALHYKADLVNGIVPANQLPSYVANITSFTSPSAFPKVGNPATIYVDDITGITYRWTGNKYVAVGQAGGITPAGTILYSPTANIPSTDVQTAITYIGNNYAPLNHPIFTGTVTGITASMVGLGDFSGLSPVTLPISTATQAALDTLQKEIATGPVMKTINGTSLLGTGNISVSKTATMNFAGNTLQSTVGIAPWSPIVNIHITSVYALIGLLSTDNITIATLINGVVVNTFILPTNTKKSNVIPLDLNLSTTDFLTVNILASSGENLSVTYTYTEI